MSKSENTKPRLGTAVVGIVVVAAAAGAAFFFREPLADWFEPLKNAKDEIGPETQPIGSKEEAPVLRSATSSYVQIQTALSDDVLDGVPASAEELVRALSAAGSDGSDDKHELARRGALAAEALTARSDLQMARQHFAVLSESLIRLVASEKELTHGYQLMECTMTDGFNKWIQEIGDTMNPYKGHKMQSCGSQIKWDLFGAQGGGGHHHHGEPHAEGGSGEIAFYTCPMHPSVREQKSAQCPICGMDLTPVTVEQSEGGVVFVDAAKQQKIGVKSEPVGRGAMRLDIRAVGKVVYDETRLHDVTLKYSGYVEKLLVNQTGQPVKRGQILFYLYSPELYAAQLELLAAVQSQESARESDQPTRGDYLVRTAREKLKLWDLSKREINAIIRSGKARRSIPVASPSSGFVTEKNLVQGAFVGEGQRLYRISALDSVWIEAQVYEYELPSVNVGQRATVTLPYLPDKEFEGEVSYLYPYLDEKTRTGRIRLELPNQRLDLRPEMYANVEIVVDLGERLRVPEEAVIYTGPRRVVFVDAGESRFAPRDVKLGVKAGQYYDVLSGIEEGEMVVTSGNFLIASESRIRSSTAWEEAGKGAGHAGHQH